jgi:hypothetical protein
MDVFHLFYAHKTCTASDLDSFLGDISFLGWISSFSQFLFGESMGLDALQLVVAEIHVVRCDIDETC